VQRVGGIGGLCGLDEGGKGIRPVGRVVDPEDLGGDQGVVEGEGLVLLVERALQQAGAYQLLLLGPDRVPRRVPPVLVDAILEQDDGEEAGLLVVGRVEVDGLGIRRGGGSALRHRARGRVEISGLVVGYLQTGVVVLVRLPGLELLGGRLALGVVGRGGGGGEGLDQLPVV
jgi:hypothetical protein